MNALLFHVSSFTIYKSSLYILYFFKIWSLEDMEKETLAYRVDRL